VQPFLTGADLSGLPYQEKKGVKYYENGKASDLLMIAARNHWHIIRLCLWVNPAADAYFAVSDLKHVTALAKRIKAAHLQFLLDLHYSDTWADPGHQKKPAAWESLPFPQLVSQVYEYSRMVIATLRQNDAPPDFVQIGNETKNGLLYGSGIDGAGEQPVPHPNGLGVGVIAWEPDTLGWDSVFDSRGNPLLAVGVLGH
jgi:arabinogalactan endo-1,4-beta-galactosidase